MATALDEMLAKVKSMPAEAKKELAEEVFKATGKWYPSAGPQSTAYYSQADQILFGGEPGGGKSQLILGLAFMEHQRSLIMRRNYGDLDRLIEDALKIHGSRQGFNGSPPPKLRINERQTIDFVAANRVGDEQSQMGKGHDLIGFDEATHFAESQVRFVMGWLRAEDETQRKRVVMATNPPLTAEGLWVIKMFAPWLDPRYPRPAQPGELRWVISDEDGRDLWVEGPDDCREIRGKIMRPVSRTYIPSKVSDNPYYAASDYERELDAMPEPYRSLLMGGFRTAFVDAEHQVIPTAWIQDAQARWKPDPPEGVPMCSIGVDAARSIDRTVLALRHDGWYAPMIAVPGKDTPDGTDIAALVVKHRQHDAVVIVDVGEGTGGSAYAHLQNNIGPENCKAYRGMDRSTKRTNDLTLGFTNKRSESYWKLREALDPGQYHGASIALPDDPELMADLTAPTFKMTPRGIQVEPKVDVVKRLGRSPDKGDAVVMAWTQGPKRLTHGEQWRQDREMGRGPGSRIRHTKFPKVNMGKRRQ